MGLESTEERETLELDPRMKEIRESLRPWLQNTPEKQKASLDKIDVQALLREIASRWPTLNAAQLAAIEKLGRKADVAKRVYAIYEKDWKRVELPSPLGVPALALLAAIFLAESERYLLQSSMRGIGLKRLNSAFNVLDRVSEAKFELNVALLRKWAEGLCQRIRS